MSVLFCREVLDNYFMVLDFCQKMVSTVNFKIFHILLMIEVGGKCLSIFKIIYC